MAVSTVAPIAELKARLSEFLEAVKSGGEVVITERGTPIARIVPLNGAGAIDARLRELARSGLVKLGEKHLPDDFFRTRGPADPQGKALDYLLRERDEGR